MSGDQNELGQILRQSDGVQSGRNECRLLVQGETDPPQLLFLLIGKLPVDSVVALQVVDQLDEARLIHFEHTAKSLCLVVPGQRRFPKAAHQLLGNLIGMKTELLFQGLDDESTLHCQKDRENLLLIRLVEKQKSIRFLGIDEFAPPFCITFGCHRFPDHLETKQQADRFDGHER